MKRRVIFIIMSVLVCMLFTGCGKEDSTTVSNIPDYTPVPTMTPSPVPTEDVNEDEAEETKEETDVSEKKVKADIITKTVKKYKEEVINIDELEGVDNFTIEEKDTILCHDSNISGSNTFSIYEKKGKGKLEKDREQSDC